MPKSVTVKVAASIFHVDFADLATECLKLLDNGADYLHLDVMDGHFVPNITYGHPVIKCLRNTIRDAFFESHMMVSNPAQWIEPMADAGADRYTFHVEPVEDVASVCRKVREAGMKVGLALSPETPPETVANYIDLADMVLVLCVKPGFGNQKFLDSMMDKVAWFRQNYPTLDIGVDGGISPSTIDACGQAGANVIVGGHSVTQAPNPGKVISTYRDTTNYYVTKH